MKKKKLSVLMAAVCALMAFSLTSCLTVKEVVPVSSPSAPQTGAPTTAGTTAAGTPSEATSETTAETAAPTGPAAGDETGAPTRATTANAGTVSTGRGDKDGAQFDGDRESERSYAAYYVDSAGGSDDNDGKSPKTPWKTLSKISRTAFQPGTKILLKAGSIWNEPLVPRSSGTADGLIVIDKYGEGPKPIINGDGEGAAVLLSNLEYIEVRNLEVTNTSDLASTRRGVYVTAGGQSAPGVLDKGGYNRHIYLINLDVHDVTAEEGGRWEGGIVFLSLVSENPAAFEDVLVQGCTVKDTDANGMSFVSNYNNRVGVSWGAKEYFPSKNIVFRGNYIADVGGDGQGFDVDINCERTVVQYNYSHDNEGGFILLCTDGVEDGFNRDITVRYNISQNDKDALFTLSGPISNVKIYNNSFYVKEGITPAPRVVGSYDWGAGKNPQNVRFTNNIFYMNGNGQDSIIDRSNVVFDTNVFYGNYSFSAIPAVNTIMADPKFVSPGSGKIGLDTVGGYKLQSGSPCIDAGKVLSDSGGRDYFGAAVPQGGKPDIGASERG